jgi:hypothetical protein
MEEETTIHMKLEDMKRILDITSSGFEDMSNHIKDIYSRLDQIDNEVKTIKELVSEKH